MTDLDKKQSKWELFKNIIAIFIAVAVAILYRVGGSANGVRWARPVGIGVGTLITLFLLFGWHWSIILSAGASAGLSTTYFKKKGTSATWKNWLLVGLAMSLALLPWAIFTHHLLGFGIRTLVLTPLIMTWCLTIGDAVLEELGRGFLILITLFLLKIGS